MKKDMENYKIMKKLSKIILQYKVIYEKAIEVNNDLKFNVDEQQDDI